VACRLGEGLVIVRLLGASALGSRALAHLEGFAKASERCVFGTAASK
jgi:hypothetical protein